MQKMKTLILMTIIVVVMWPLHTFAGEVNLPKTGQTTCYDAAGNVIDCAGTGQDGDIQAGVAWPSPRFVDNGDGTVTDRLTGLVWLKDAGCAGQMNWANAVAYCNNLASGTCGLTDGSVAGDWRLPNIVELASLWNLNVPREDFWLNTQGFTNVQYYYFSATTFAYYTPHHSAWAVWIPSGQIGVAAKTSIYHYVWPVRGRQSGSLGDLDIPCRTWKTGQKESYAIGDDGDLQNGVSWPTPRFTDNNNGTVTDHLTGLIWLKDANPTGSPLMWAAALDFCNNLSSGSYGLTDGSVAGDWRLPNKKELFSLIDFSQIKSALPQEHPFQGCPSSDLGLTSLPRYWTATNATNYNGTYAWEVITNLGAVFAYHKADDIGYVWPVKGGLCNSTAPPDKPALHSPSDNATNVSLTPELTAGGFYDPDTDNTHFHTRWQISTDSNFSSLIINTTSSVHLTTLSVPNLALQGETTYYWRVKFYDSCNSSSEWSDVYSFTTEIESGDNNSNGIPDIQENDTVDMDGDNTADINQLDIIKSLNTVAGNGQMGISIRDEPKVEEIVSIESIDPDTISQIARTYNMPLGLFAIRLKVTHRGDSVEVPVYLSEAAAADAKWYRYDSIHGWQDFAAYATFSEDRKTVMLQLKDGGYGDADGVANGFIVDPCGAGFASWVNGCVRDAESGKIICNAELKFKSCLTNNELSLKPVLDGNYFSIIFPDNYVITVSAPGYAGITTSIEIPEVTNVKKDFELTCNGLDSDGDLTPDCNDKCPNDPNKVTPGACGCGVGDTDSDGDGTADCRDNCPDDSDNDSDDDGICGSQDICPNTPSGEAVDNSGCSVSQNNSDDKPPVVKTLKVNGGSKVSIFAINLETAIQGKTDKYKVWEGLSEPSVWNVLPQADSSGKYIIPIELKPSLPGDKNFGTKRNVYFRAAFYNKWSKTKKVSVSLIVPKVSGFKVNGNNKAAPGEGEVSVTFKASNAVYYYISGDQNFTGVTAMPISSLGVIGKGGYVASFDLSGISEATKGKGYIKTVYLKVANQVNESKVVKAVVKIVSP